MSDGRPSTPLERMNVMREKACLASPSWSGFLSSPRKTGSLPGGRPTPIGRWATHFPRHVPAARVQHRDLSKLLVCLGTWGWIGLYLRRQ